MVEILSVQPGSPLVAAGRELFAAYREFLETIASTHCFDFPRYAEEMATLPAAYTDARGELLIALAEGQAAGCIAYRHAAGELDTTCEIKRLFIAPGYRRQGLGRALILEAMRSAGARGFTRAILDTDVVSMPAAYGAYLAIGFSEYNPPGSHAPSLRFLERSLI